MDKKTEIYTLTLNPALDITLITESIDKDSINLTDAKSVSAGGKGFNTSRALGCLGIKSTAIALLGGFFENDMKRCLEKEKINFRFIPIKAGTRVNIKVIEKRTAKLIELNGRGPVIEQDEISSLFNFLDDKFSQNGCNLYNNNARGYFIISGSLPQNTDPRIYGRIIKMLKPKGVTSLLDTSGEPLYHGINALPDILKINRQELDSVCKEYFKQGAKDFITKFLKKGIKIIMITNGPGQIEYFDKNNAYLIKPPDIQGDFKTGSGDSVNAGLIYALLNKYMTEEMIKFAIACGNANILNEIPGKLEMEKVNSLIPEIEIKKL